MVVEAQNIQETEVKQTTPDIWEQKQQELGRKAEETQQVKQCFFNIQEDIQEPIDDYIKNIDDFFLDNFLSTPENNREESYKNKIIAFLEKQNIQPTFTTYKKFEGEKQETVAAKQETITEKQETITEKQETIAEKEKLSKDIEKAQSFQRTEESYQKLDSNIQTKVELAVSKEENKDSINEIKQKLEKEGITDKNLINQYTKFSIAKNIIGNNPDNTESKTFLKDFQELQNTLGIIDDIGDITESKNISQTTTNILNNSPSLKQESEKPNQTIDNINIEDKDLIDYISDSNIDKLKDQKDQIQKEYPEEKIFEKDSFFILKDFKIKPEQKSIIEYNNFLNKNLSETKDRVELAKNTIKQQLTITPLLGISRYLDTQIGENRLDNDFLINPTDDIKVENDILEIGGTIDGKKIKLKQNLKDGTLEDNQLQTNDYLTINKEDKISLGENNMQGIGVILPNKAILNQKAERRIKDNFKQEIKNPDGLEERISNNIGGELLKDYGFDNIVKNRLSTSIERNITKQESLSFLEKHLGNSIKEGDLSKDGLGNQEGGNFQIIKKLIKGIDGLSKEECVVLNKNIQKFDKIVVKSQNQEELKNDNILKNFNEKNNKLTKQNREKNPKEENNVFKFLNCLLDKNGEKNKINLNDFSNLISIREKNETVQNNDRNFSQNFKEKYEKKYTTDNAEYADKILELDTRPESPTIKKNNP